MSNSEVEIVRRTDSELVPATLLEEMAPSDLLVVDQEWAPVRSTILQELLKHAVPKEQWPQSLHWDWSLKSGELRLLAASGFGVVCDKKWQGVMLTKTGFDSRHPNSTGKPIVYIDYLESGPWNWNIEQIGQVGTYKAVGAVLFRQAVIQSREENFCGRIGLHALPQAIAFYQGLGMDNLGEDPTKSNLPYFELTEAKALSILAERGDSNE